MTSVKFDINASERIAHKSSVAVSVAFTPTTPIPSGGSITLIYPDGFFAMSVTPTVSVGASSVANLSATCGATTVARFVLTTSGATIDALPFTVTIRGLKMGPWTSNKFGVAVQTSTDAAPSVSIASGAILDVAGITARKVKIQQSIQSALQISYFEVIDAVSSVNVALNKNANSSCRLNAVSNTAENPIRNKALRGPNRFCDFLSDAPVVFKDCGFHSCCSCTSASATNICCGSTTRTDGPWWLVDLGADFQISHVVYYNRGDCCWDRIDAAVQLLDSNNVEIFKHRNSLTYLNSDRKEILYFNATSTYVSFSMMHSDRVAGRSNVSATISFKPCSLIPTNRNITLTYPSGFFASVGTPGVTISGGGPTGTVATLTSTQIIITTATQAIAASTAVTVTLTGLIMGAATAGSSNGITISTSADQTASLLASGSVVLGVVSSVLPFVLPSSSHSTLIVYGTGFTEWSGSVRIGGTVCESTTWTNVSTVVCRVANGLGVRLSVTGSINLYGSLNLYGSFSHAFSYSVPSISFMPSKRLSGINVTGANFGPYLAGNARHSSWTNMLLPPQTSAVVCNSTDFDVRDAGVTITSASASITFFNPIRLDDVVIVLRSPRGAEYTLMRNKCFGAMPCGLLTSVSLTFHILPVTQLLHAPGVACPPVGTFAPENPHDLSLELLSQSANGRWSLIVVTGSQYQNVSRADLNFVTTALDFHIGNSSISSLKWFSDSSVSIKAPGYLDADGIESSSGFGRNRTVSTLNSGLSFASSSIYSYPDPILTGAIIANSFSASGNTIMQLQGRFFSNSNSNPRARAGFTSCYSTRWLSDTAMTCNQSPSLGVIRNLAVTIENSDVAGIFVVVSTTPIGLVNQTYMSVASTASSVTVHGSGLGVWDSSVRLRHFNSLSSAAATMWLCDTRISTKVFPFVSKILTFKLSLVSVAYNVSSLSRPEFQSSIITFTKFNVPSTGSVIVIATGAAFGLHAASSKASMGGSCCTESRWASHSSVSCKTPSGFPMHSNSLPIFATSSGTSTYVIGLSLSFDTPAVNRSADAVSDNSNTCFFNSSGCVPGKLFQLVHSASGFGTCALPLRQLTLVQGSQSRPFDNTTWVSDSSVYCLFSADVSPEFRDLQVVVQPASLPVSILNPFYLPTPPMLSNQTVHYRFFRNLVFPRGEDKRYLEFGTTSGFVWPNSSLVENIHYSEVLKFSFLIFIHASQFFMDSNFLPIETNVSLSVTVWSSINVTSLVLCDEAPFKQLSFSLPPRLFWAQVNVSLGVCAPKLLNGQSLHLRTDVNAQNVNGHLHSSVVSPAFRVFSSGAASVIFIKQPLVQIRAASIHKDALSFRFKYGSELDEVCEQGGMGLLKYSILMFCSGQKSNFRSVPPTSQTFIESTQCLQNVSEISFIRPSKVCQFNVSVLTDGIVFQTSQFFEIVPGFAKIAVLVGEGPFCASAGALVWSVNSSSDGLCLVAQLQDAEGNNITSAVNATVIARDLNSLEPNYRVARSASNTSNNVGFIRWCDAYSSKAQNVGAVFGARVNENITYWESSVINVSSTGFPSNLIPVNAAFSSNSTFLPGKLLPKLGFSIEDAGGNAFVGSSRVSVRVRIVPRLNTTTSRSVASISGSSRTQTRRLLQTSTFATSECNRHTPLEFTFIQSSNSSQIFAGPDFLCRTGLNDIFFDVGTFSNGSFFPTVSNAFTISVIVSPGEFKFYFLVNFVGAFVAASYSIIDNLEIMFLDAGLNEVYGNATMSLVCINASVFVYPAKAFTVISNASIKTYAPSFFLYVLDWLPSETPIMIGLTAVNSSALQYETNIVTLQLKQSCFTGHRVVISSHAELFAHMKLKKMSSNISTTGEISSICEKCPNGTISNSFDALLCRLAILLLMTPSADF